MPKSILLFFILAGASCGVDRAGTCLADEDCPAPDRCDVASGLCAAGCVRARDCPAGQVCGDHGRCVDGPPIDANVLADDASFVDASPVVEGGAPELGASSDGGVPDLARYADLWICLGGCPEHGGNQDPNHAADESENATLTDLSICPQGDTDYFRVVPSHDGMFTATLTLGACGPDLMVDILASDGRTVIGDSMPAPSGAAAQAGATKNTPLFVRVSALESTGQNFYSLALANH